MNLDLVTTFTAVAADLMATFGREVTHTDVDGDEVQIQAVIESALSPVGEYGERMEQRTTVTVAKSAGVTVGDTLRYAGTATDDDPYPDDVIWSMTQVLSDDGFVQQFAVRQVTE